MTAEKATKNKNRNEDRNDLLNKVFSEVGMEYGYENVTAEFAVYREFKVKWKRSTKWAEFTVSDYLYDAPENIIVDLARTFIGMISGQSGEGYSDDFIKFVTSDKFVETKQPVYLRRSRLTADTEGRAKDLKESVDRLAEAGLIKKDDRIAMCWTKEVLAGKAAYCSVLMKTVAVSSMLDSEEVSDKVLDLAVLHEYLTVVYGNKGFGKPNTTDLGSLERKMQGYDEAVDCMRTMGAYL